MAYLIILILSIFSFITKRYLIKRSHINPLDKINLWPYEKRSQLLNPLEITFYQNMKKHLSPGLMIFPKVGMPHLVYFSPKGRLTEAMRTKIMDKYLDFAICDIHDFRLVCVVEFDDGVDTDRNLEEIADIEKILKGAVIKLFRYSPQYEYLPSDFDRINQLFTNDNF